MTLGESTRRLLARGRLSVARSTTLPLPALRGVLIALLMVTGLSVSGALRPLDDAVYDLLVGLRPFERPPQQRVLLLESRREATDWRVVTDHLFAAGVQQVGFVIELSAAEVTRLASSPHASRIVVGVPLSEHREHPEAVAIAPPLRAGALFVPAESQGLRREQRRLISERRPPLPTLEAELAGVASGDEVFGVNFNDGPELPRLAAAEVARASPVRQLSEGRTALIGAGADPYVLDLHAPGVRRALTPLEFHGLALDTLLRERAIDRLGPAALLVTLLGLGLLGYLVSMPLRPQQGFMVLFGSLLGWFVAGGLLLHGFNVWLPLTEGIVTGVAVAVIVMHGKLVREDRRLQALARSAQRQLGRWVLPTGFAESEEHWAHVVNLVDQMLLLERTILLERMPGDHRVREVQALRCSIDDIGERRRDYQRHPYTAAIEQRGPFELPADRQFLRPTDRRERQYLVPLIYGGEVLGFWALTVSPASIDDERRFLAAIERLAEQIGALLYQRQAWRTDRAVQDSRLSRFLADTLSQSTTQLTQSLAALDARLSRFQEVSAGVASATLLYDLFGRVVLVNRSMTALLAEWGLQAYELRAVDLLAALSGRSADECRNALRTLVIDGRELTFEVVAPTDRRQRYLLQLHALRADEAEAGEGPAHGILLELISTTQAHRELRHRTEALDFAFAQVERSLAEPTSPAGDPLPALRAQVEGAQVWLHRVKGLVRRGSAADGGATAILLLPRLQRAVDALRQQTFLVAVGGLEALPPCLAYAEPLELERALAAALQLLAADALSESSIDLRLRVDDSEHVRLELANQGFGLPPERVVAIWTADDDAEEPWASLRRARRLFPRWGGAVEVSGALGEGFRVVFRLRAYT